VGDTNRTDDNDNIGLAVLTVSRDLLYQAHRYVLHNNDEVQHYINEHMDFIRHINQTKREK